MKTIITLKQADFSMHIETEMSESEFRIQCEQLRMLVVENITLFASAMKGE